MAAVDLSNALVSRIVREYRIPKWDAVNRVTFNMIELGYTGPITPEQAAEIERCIAADLKAGK